MITRTCSFVKGNQESGTQVPNHIQRLESWINANSGVVDNLRKHDEVLQDDHPYLEGEEVSQSQINEQSHV